MKYIKPYQVFESNVYEDVIRNLEDILLEASDMGYETKVDWYSEIGGGLTQIDPYIYTDYDKPLDLYDLNDCIERIIEYMKSLKMFHLPTAIIGYINDDEIRTRVVGWKQLDFTHDCSEELKDLDIFSVKLKFRLKYKFYE